MSADPEMRLWSVRVTYSAYIEANSGTAAEDAAVERITDFLTAGGPVGFGVEYETSPATPEDNPDEG